MAKLLLMILMAWASIGAHAQNYRVRAVRKGGKDTSVSNIAASKKLPETTVWIPSVFTPDMDGLNDMFAPVVLNADSFQIEIFSREGQLLASLKAGEKWAGTGTESAYIWLAKWRTTSGKWVRESGVLIQVGTPYYSK